MESVATLLDTTPAALRYGTRQDHSPGSRLLREEARNHQASIAAEDSVPAVGAGLPKRVRVWMHGFLLELAHADVSDREIEEARRVLTSPENYRFFGGGESRTYTEDEAIMGLEAFAIAIREVLRKRGHKVKAR